MSESFKVMLPSYNLVCLPEQLSHAFEVVFNANLAKKILMCLTVVGKF
jgi:hypothetical protein